VPSYYIKKQKEVQPLKKLV